MGQWDERGGAFKEVRKLDFQEPSEVGFEFTEFLRAIGHESFSFPGGYHRVLGTLFFRRL
jgi:hypothetical protein